jgi:hypothetical protein
VEKSWNVNGQNGTHFFQKNKQKKASASPYGSAESEKKVGMTSSFGRLRSPLHFQSSRLSQV